MPKHMTIINLACTITKLRKWGEAWKHSAESAQATTARMQQANKELEREKFMTAGLIDKLIADRDAAWKERDTQAADHEAKMVEHRAAFGVRTEADAKIIAGLQEKVYKYKAERDDLYQREGIEKKRRMDVEDERNALRAEVAELKTQLERLTSWAVKNQAARETLQSEIERLKSQTPKQHPVKVGEWLKRTSFDHGPNTRIGAIAKVVGFDADGDYQVSINGTVVCWCPSNCTPCDPPPEASHDTPEGLKTAEGAVEPKAGDVVRLVRVPTNDEYPHDSGRWEPNWGGIGDYMRVHYVGSNINGTRVVRAVFGLEWPLSCVEVVKGGDK